MADVDEDSLGSGAPDGDELRTDAIELDVTAS